MAFRRKTTASVRFCLAFALLLGALPALAGVAVEGLRVWRAPDHTRLVFDVSGPARHSVSELHDPERLVIDVQQGRLATALQSVDLSETQVQRIRSGKYGADKLRIVLDLRGKVRQKSFLLPPSSGQGDRLIVDLFGPVPRTQPEPPAPAVATVAVPEPLPASAPAPAPARPDDSPAPEPKTPPPAEPAQGASEREPEPAAPLPPQRLRGRSILVAVDAGHGGEDPGAIGPRQIREKDVVLAIARELEKRINTRPGYRATMVRTGDYFIPLAKRRDIARETGADLFVSIHADAFTHERARGSSVYALSQRGATSVSAAFLAQRENGADLIGGVDLGAKDEVLAGVLTDLSMTASLDASLGVGSRVLNSMGRISHLHKNRVEQAGFAVLKSPDMPSILVETGFISNPLEAERLNNAGYQRNMATAIFSGVSDYFLNNPPPETLVAMSVRAGERPSEYVIAHGDTLSGIAERYRVSVTDIVRTNGLGGRNDIRAGQTIVIPQT
jgi:N-acetylmuramoyl-L-alanine amidase